MGIILSISIFKVKHHNSYLILGRQSRASGNIPKRSKCYNLLHGSSVSE